MLGDAWWLMVEPDLRPTLLDVRRTEKGDLSSHKASLDFRAVSASDMCEEKMRLQDCQSTYLLQRTEDAKGGVARRLVPAYGYVRAE